MASMSTSQDPRLRHIATYKTTVDGRLDSGGLTAQTRTTNFVGSFDAVHEPSPRTRSQNRQRDATLRSTVGGRITKASSSRAPPSTVAPAKTKPSRKAKHKINSITAPLSELTKDSTVPIRDIEAFVSRPLSDRVQELSAKKNGKVPRPMNSFMLYRSAYAERAKEWGKKQNHQIISSIAGASWAMEPPTVRAKFQAWAETEKKRHKAAFPAYKYTPGKAKNNAYGDGDNQSEGFDACASDEEYTPKKRRPARRAAKQQSTPYFEPKAPVPVNVQSSAADPDFNEYSWPAQHFHDVPQIPYSYPAVCGLSYDTSHQYDPAWNSLPSQHDVMSRPYQIAPGPRSIPMPQHSDVAPFAAQHFDASAALEYEELYCWPQPLTQFHHPESSLVHPAEYTPQINSASQTYLDWILSGNHGGEQQQFSVDPTLLNPNQHVASQI